MSGITILRAALIAGVSSIALASAAAAQSQASVQSFDIPPGDLKLALDSYGRETGTPLIYRSEEVRGRTTAGVRGTMSPTAALSRILEGSGLVAIRDRTGAIVISSPQDSAAPSGGVARLEDVIVTGTRIRGAQSTSPVIRISQDEMRNAGQTNLGEVARSIPQNWGGGQNPTVTAGSNRSDDTNYSSASTLNLRGIGGAATLTLLNGHRLAYNGISQSVDISAIPIAAVDRLEIVPDGASAIYGSDAVAGVANVILRRDFEGLHTSARVGASTDGGNEQYQLSAVGGTVWEDGGILIALDHGHTGELAAGDRSYTRDNPRGWTLIPEQTYQSAVISAHHQLDRLARFEVDALYNRRDSSVFTPINLVDEYWQNGSSVDPIELTSYAVAPRLTFDFANGWSASGSVVYAKDTTDTWLNSYSNSALTGVFITHSDNSMFSAELDGEGPIWRSAAGEARLALGLGYRRTGLWSYGATEFGGTTTVSRNFDSDQDSHYAYGELFLPLIGPEQGLAFAKRLILTAAARYEDYGESGDVTTPRLGISYEPNSDIELKASWGRSFITPTLFQRFQGNSVPLLQPTSTYGSTGHPAGSAVIRLDGSNEALTPEEATTWSVSTVWRPQSLSGLRVEIGYFNVDYRDRIVIPVQGSLGLLENPIYDFLITRNPTPAEIAAILAGFPPGFRNRTGAPYDPAKVIAIVDNRWRNVARWTAEGIDFQADYDTSIGQYGRLTASLQASYLESDQELAPGVGKVQLAGTIFDPPHWRARGGLVWTLGDFTLASYINFTDGVLDDRQPPPVNVRSMTTFDLTGRYQLNDAPGVLNGVELSLSVLNLFDEEPGPIRGSVTAPEYDSTNYSSVGRFVGFTIGKHW